MINSLLSVVYVLSGLCGLIYQTVWIRKFTLVFGATLPAMSAVVAIFFLGLAVGSWLLGRVSVSAKNPIRLYAIIECIIGIYALAFPTLLAGMEAVYGRLYPSLSTHPASLQVVRLGITLLLLIAPTLLMGGTLPLLARHFVTELRKAGDQTGLLYGLNALGAALGCFLSGYFLFQTMGINGTNTLTAVINLLVGFFALWLSRKTGTLRAHEGSRRQEEEQGPAGRWPAKVWLAVGCFAVSGFVSMAYELIWLRYLLFYFRDTAYLYSGIIAVFIIGIAAGSFMYRWFLSRVASPFALFGLLQLGIGLSTALAIYLPIPWHQFFFDAAEASRGFLLALLFLLLIMPTVLMGATFPTIARIITTDVSRVGCEIGKAYALNTIGSILGTLAAGFLFLPLLGLQVTLYLLLGSNMLLATILIAAGAEWKYWSAVPVATSLLLSVGLQYGLHGHLPDLLVHRISLGEQILEVEEGITGTTWATSSPFGMKLLENRVVISRTGPGSFPIQGYIPIVLAPRIPRSVLGLCFGGGVSSHAGTLFPEVEHFDFVDISKQNIRIALNNFVHNKGLSTDQRVRFVIDDAYNFVKYAGNSYDLILMDPNPPTLSFRCAVLYTKEFYELARARLTDEGYFSQVVPLDHMSELEVMSVMRTFSSVFEHCVLWWNGVDPVMIGSRRPFRFDLREVSERLERPLVQKYVAEHSAGARYHLLGYFLSGFLLTDNGFRRVAAEGRLLTTDLTPLEFSTSRTVTPASVERIENNLSSWVEIRGLMAYAPGIDQFVEQIEAQRSYLMRMLYTMVMRFRPSGTK
ncbi:MAG TPA: fused MFS/spermidine synthase [Syntrophorhabdales bacterium]|nr:fused MFS/spermidine synthase [Syntrophorhabdales bacterium]